MNNKRATKRALLTSVMALVMCVVMLVGTTFAWFTDTASTAVNKIQAGNLKMEVMYRTSNNESTDSGTWKPIADRTDLFGTEGTLFEPGHTRVVELKIKNAGNLRLKYKISMNVASETVGTNKAGSPYKLSNYLKVANTAIMACNTGNITTDAVAAWLDAGVFTKNFSGWNSERNFANFELEKTDNGVVNELLPGGEAILGMKVYMPEDVGNEANARTSEEAASISFGLNILATQYIGETDSFGNNYDKDAQYDDVTYMGVTDQTSLDKALANSMTSEKPSYVSLPSGNFTVNSENTIGKDTTLAGEGKNKTTLSADNAKVSGDNVTFKDMTINGSGSAGTGGTLNINGNNTTVENVDYKGDGNIAIAVSTGGRNSGTTFRGTKITNAFRGIQFWSLSGDSVIDNCVLDVAGYTFNIDAAVADSTLTITDSTLNGWTSYTSGIKLVTFERCKLGLNAYRYLRPYSETKLVNCEFTSDGYQLNAGGSDEYTITLTNCTKNGTPITADNVKALLLDTEDWNTNAILIVNGVSVSV